MRTTRHVPALVLSAIATVFLLSPSLLTAAGKATGSPAAPTEPSSATRQQVNLPAPPSPAPKTVEAQKLEERKKFDEEERKKFDEEKKKNLEAEKKWESNLKKFLFVLVVVAMAAAFGGFAHGLTRREPEEHTILWPYHQLKKKLGILGDIVIGIAAGLAVFLVMDALFGVHVKPFTDDDNNIEQLLRLVALGVICGYLGTPLLDSLGVVIQTRLTKQKESLEKEEAELKSLRARLKAYSDVTDYISLAAAYRDWRMWTEAKDQLDFAIKVDENNPQPWIEQSLLYAAQAEDKENESQPEKQRVLYAKAVEATTTAIAKMKDPAMKDGEDKTFARAYFDRACYKCRMGSPKEEVLADLKEAIKRNDMLKKMATHDRDFSSIKDTEEFKKVLSAGAKP